ncbi:hypothetical protein [Mycobacterium sp.]|uniref:hypothetical protein n=1 Tax=Mycobacterium sp. TaxID=1785 RepID=UPI002BC7DD92|nr:hypothetical protein [Mycobacterium sp.]HKP44688.1 hypothetical protein [Mycobacterium sp.]
MGDEGEDAAPTGVAPTELGSAIEETEAHTAWSLDDGEDWPEQRLTPARITWMVVAGSVVVIAVASTVAWMVLHDRSEPAAGPVPTSSVQPMPPSTPVAASPSPSSTALPPRPQPAAPVTLPMDAYGQVHVRTVSGRTVCAMTAGDVQCNVQFTNRLGPIYNGMPVSGVGVNSRGAWQWRYGDPGDPDYVTMVYGTVYHAMGWIITPSSQGTTFMYDATGHGMTISVDGFATF